MSIDTVDTTGIEDRIIDTRDIRTKGRLIGLFLVGLICLFYSGQFIITIWTPKSSLVPITGRLENCDVSITNVNAPDRYGGDHFSRKAELILYLKEHRTKFALAKNIGDDYSDERYSEIKNKLEYANTITVWIKKSELEYFEPKIFMIETDRGETLAFDEVRFKDRSIALFLCVLGIGCTIFPIYAFYPNLFKKRSQ